MYFNIFEILHVCGIPVYRLAGVTDDVWKEGIAVVNKYGPAGLHDVSQ
jgi:hypothetical protein